MALVRRSTIVGQLDRAVAKGVDEVSGALATKVKAVTGNGTSASTTPSSAPSGTSSSGTSSSGTPVPAEPGSGDATVSLSSPPAWAQNAEAAAVASKGASVASIFLGFLFVAVGTGGAYALIRWGNRMSPFEIGDQVSTYAALIVFAGAVERILEPFSNLLPGGRARAQYENAVAALTNGHPASSLREVATAKAKLDRALANRTVLMWGLATGVAALVSAAGGFYLLHMIAASGWVSQIPTWVDALVTGLVVGTGTKPLHDLISRTQAAKDNAKG